MKAIIMRYIWITQRWTIFYS